MNDQPARNPAAPPYCDDHFRDIFDGMLEGCQLVGFDWRYLYLNQAAARHNRRANQDLLGRTMMESWPGFEETEVFAMLQRCMHERVALTMEVDFVFPDDSNGWFEVRGQPVPDGIFILSIDISERKRAEQALIESRQQLSVVFDHLREGLVMSDTDGSHLRINPAGLRMHDLDDAEVACHPLRDFEKVFELSTLDGKALGIEDWPLSRALRGEDVRELVLKVRKPGQDWERFFSYTGGPARYAQDKLQGFVAIHDVTGQRHAEAFRLAVTGAEIGTWHWDIVSGKLDYSDHCRTIFGIPPEEAMSYARFLEAVHPEDRERVDLAVQQALAAHEAYEVEMRSLHANGSVRWARSKGQAYYDANGKPLRMEGAAIDISRQKAAEAELLELNARLQAANRELQAFSYSISHDLRAPLRGIDGWSLALLEDYGDKLDAQAREYLQRVRAETQQMGNLIDSLLMLSRVTQQELHSAPVDLSQMAESIVRALREADPERQVELVIQPGLQALGDAGMLRSALTNLIGNAWKFTGKQPHARIEFACEASAGVGVYCIRDNGAGFDMAHASRLFSPFQRLHRQSEFDGTGVGLALSHRIIGRHGGRIWVESELGRGTTFFFTLGGAA